MILPAKIADEHVSRLHVSVNEARIMDCLERGRHLAPNVHHAIRGQPLLEIDLEIDEGPQLYAVDPLHGQVEPAVVLAGIKDRNDVGVVD